MCTNIMIYWYIYPAQDCMYLQFHIPLYPGMYRHPSTCTYRYIPEQDFKKIKYLNDIHVYTFLPLSWRVHWHAGRYAPVYTTASYIPVLTQYTPGHTGTDRYYIAGCQDSRWPSPSHWQADIHCWSWCSSDTQADSGSDSVCRVIGLRWPATESRSRSQQLTATVTSLVRLACQPLPGTEAAQLPMGQGKLTQHCKDISKSRYHQEIELRLYAIMFISIDHTRLCTIISDYTRLFY